MSLGGAPVPRLCFDLQVLCLQFVHTPDGLRFDTLSSELGDAHIRVEVEGRGHSTVATHRRQGAICAVLDFFADYFR